MLDASEDLWDVFVPFSFFSPRVGAALRVCITGAAHKFHDLTSGKDGILFCATFKVTDLVSMTHTTMVLYGGCFCAPIGSGSV